MEKFIIFNDEELSLTDALELWKNASDAYYNDTDGEFLMTDEQFDELDEQLKNCEDSEIVKIVTESIQTKDGLVNANKTSMISLKKEKFENKSSMISALRFLGLNLSNYATNCSYAPKLDGMALKVVFDTETDELILAQTRGGQDITDLMRNHEDLKIRKLPKSGIVHGELVVSKKVFEEKYSEEYVNPRNAVPGILKQNVHDLRFIVCTDGISPIYGEGSIWKIFNNLAEIENYHKFFKTEDFPYQTDGIVIGYPVLKQTIKDNYPMNLIAIKFPAPTARTKCIGITYTQKKSGALTPIILIEPTKLDGSTISKLAGYNYANLKLNHIGIGSELLITKSGDIIPVVKKVLSRSNNIPMPTVDYTISGKHLMAVDTEESENYRFILALKLMQIDGIGDTIADKIGSMVEYDIVKLFNPGYKPDIREILGDGKVWLKFETFYQTKTITLDLLIHLLQFARCGKTLSKTFAHIITGKPTDTGGIDKKVLLYVCKGEGFQKIKSSVATLKSFGVNVIKPIDINEDSITFEMTGNPQKGMTKNQFIEEVKKRYPNSVHVTLTKDTKFLVCDSLESTSSKLNKARKYNTTIITYNQVLKDGFK